MIRRKDISKSYQQKSIWHDKTWQIHQGSLTSRKREKPNGLFEIIAEKLPINSLSEIEKYLKDNKLSRTGIYIAHDSMGYSRYVGLGGIFYRIRRRYRAHPHEIKFYSFYSVPDKSHQRELETLLIRIASPLLVFNSQKKRETTEIGSVKDYSAGTIFFQRKPVRQRIKKKSKTKH